MLRGLSDIFESWQSRLRTIIDILETSEVNEIEVSFFGRKIRVSKGKSGPYNFCTNTNYLFRLENSGLNGKNKREIYVFPIFSDVYSKYQSKERNVS